MKNNNPKGIILILIGMLIFSIQDSIMKYIYNSTSLYEIYIIRTLVSFLIIFLFLKLTKNRRSVRWFLPKPVPRKMIAQAILAAVQSPSSCNRLPYEFRVIDDEKMVSEVSKIPMGTKGFGFQFHTLCIIHFCVALRTAFTRPEPTSFTSAFIAGVIPSPICCAWSHHAWYSPFSLSKDNEKN